MAVVDPHFLRALVVYLFLFFLLFSFTFGLYDDQIGLFDWKKSFVGKIEYVHFDSSVANSKRVLVSTEANVLAALNSRTGNIIWRRVLERSNNTVDKLLHFSDRLVSLSGNGRFLRSWEAATGNIIWEANVFPSGGSATDENGVEQLSAHGLSSVDCIFSNENVIVLAKNRLKAFSVDTGKELWTREDSSNSKLFGLFMDMDKVFSLGVKNDVETFMQKLNVETGRVEYRHVLDAPWLLSAKTSCIYIGDAVVCVVPADNSIYSLKLQSDRVAVRSTQLSVLSVDSGDISNLKLSFPHSPSAKHNRKEFVLHLSSTHSMLLKLATDLSITLLKEFSMETLFFSSVIGGGDPVIMTAAITSDTVLMNCYNMDGMNEIEGLRQTVKFPEHHGKLVRIFAHFFTRKDNTIGYRVLAMFQDYSLLLLQHTGRIFWTREESLASITAVEMIELPVSPKQANFEALQREFGYHNDGRVLSMFTQRIQAQFQQLQAFVASLNIDRVENVADNDEQKNGEELTRDQFDLRKIIVVVTASGKLYGLDSIDGSIIWQKFIPDLAPFYAGRKSQSLLYMQRSVAHFPLVPQCVVVGKSRSGQGSVLFTFNPSNGKSTEKDYPLGMKLPYDIEQTVLLPYHDEKFSKLLLLVDSMHNAYVFPGSEDAYSLIKSKAKSIFINIANKSTGELKGYVLNGDSQQLRVQEVWNIQLPTAEHIIDQTVSKRLGEHVHSPGRVLGDRRVLYKYLNPNLMAVFSRSPSISKPIVNILLIDSVTGNIIYHGRHRNAQGPLLVVHSENWIVYKYYNTKARRHELAVLELYEGYTERNSTAFSSLDPPLSPMVLQQSYIFPFNVESMTTTVTNAGITKKNLLIGVSLGYVYAIPKMFLDPRRNLTDSPKLREEGLMPYIPELPVITQSFINYNQTVSNIQGIYTSPAGLESTCLVFTYGLDLYFTRVTPSKLFDVLKEDFDYWFISVTVILLGLVTLISSRLASVKLLRQVWH